MQSHPSGGDGRVKQTVIISGFPGVGKSYFCNRASGLIVVDSDSSKFSHLPDFPRNYVRHIEENIGKADVILVSTHQSVRDALRERGIRYVLVYPDRSQKEAYLERYRKRGSSDGFISMLEREWDAFIDSIEQETFPVKIKLSKDCEYLLDALLVVMEEKGSGNVERNP